MLKQVPPLPFLLFLGSILLRELKERLILNLLRDKDWKSNAMKIIDDICCCSERGASL